MTTPSFFGTVPPFYPWVGGPWLGPFWGFFSLKILFFFCETTYMSRVKAAKKGRPRQFSARWMAARVVAVQKAMIEALPRAQWLSSGVRLRVARGLRTPVSLRTVQRYMRRWPKPVLTANECRGYPRHAYFVSQY